jgi:hypothetical protein
MILKGRRREGDTNVIEAALLVSAAVAVFWAVTVYIQTLHRA